MSRTAGQSATTLHELFDAWNIELHEVPRPGGRDHGGSRSKLYCPDCGGGRERERNFFVKVDPDGQGFRFCCHRASCGVTGGARLPNAAHMPKTAWAPKVYRRPAPPTLTPLPESLVSYFEGFGISEATLQAFGIYRCERPMPEIDGDGKQVRDRWSPRATIAYPYRDGGDLVNVKYKAIYPRPGKTVKRFIQEKDAQPALFNIDAFTDPDGLGIIVEGEDDVLALAEVGFRQVTTVADGTPPKLAAHYDPLTDDDERYAAIRGEERIHRLEKIILAGDDDDAGRRHHEELARRIGKAKCWLVRWPEGCKDAKDTLKQHGAEKVLEVIEAAAPYPLEGVETIEDKAALDLQAGITARRYTTGYRCIDEKFALSGAGQLIVVTGVPGHGKTAACTALATLFTERLEEEARCTVGLPPFHTIVYSGETDSTRVALDLASQRLHKPAFQHPIVPNITAEELTGIGLPWVRKHFTFLRWPDLQTDPPISWVLARVRELTIRHKSKLVILDPWQEFDDEMPDTERNSSKWIGKVIGRIRAMAVELRINIVLVVHPTKRRRVDGKFPMPVGDDIADSRFFYTKPSIGLTVHRENIDSDEMLIHVWKAKDMQFAMCGDIPLRFDKLTKRIWPRPQAVDAWTNPEPYRQDLHG